MKAAALTRPRIGCVPYLNAKPLIFGHAREVRFLPPAPLADLLAGGGLDAGLSPVFEWLRAPTDYRAVDGVGIACRGAVHSVFLAHAGPLTGLRRVWLDPSSRSSAHLVRVLLAEFHGVTPEFVPLDAARLLDPPAPRAGEGLLLIGDQANRFRARPGRKSALLDLGAEWLRATDLPFVFALWLIRRPFRQGAELAATLRGWRQANAGRLESIVARHAPETRAFARHYLSECIRFEIGAAEKAGLAEYARLLVRHRLIDASPGRLDWI